MGAIRPSRRVNLICGILSDDEHLMARATQLLKRHVGPIDETSQTWPFDTTDYYEPQMGTDLKRQFVSFAELFDPAQLPYLKRLTNDLENAVRRDLALPETRRPVNLDPGYMALSKLVLATTKDYSHRIYLREGIYAECTLRYHAGRWEPWPWTYPDYADTRYHPFFTRVRDGLKTKLSREEHGADGDQGGTP